MLLLLLLSSVAWGQSTDTVKADASRLNFLDQSIKEIESGRPTITGVPTYQGGIKFSNTIGNALTFQDATTQNTAAVIPSGQNVLTSSNTVGNSGTYTSTASYSALLYDVFTPVAIASFTAVGAMTFTNWYSSYTYHLEFNLRQNTSNGEIRARFDNDTTAGNYRSVVTDSNSGGGSGSAVDAGATGYLLVTGATDIVQAGFPISGFCEIQSDPIGRGRLQIYCMRTYVNQAGPIDGGTNFGWYTAATVDPQSFTLLTSVGTMTGYARVLARAQKLAY